MQPAENFSGASSFDITVAERSYTKYFVCKGSGVIRVWDSAAGEEPMEPEEWPCDGTRVESVAHFDEPGERVIRVEASEPGRSDWSLVAVQGLPDGMELSE